MIGPGKYDELTTWVREKTNGETVVVIVIGGARGSGFDVQSTKPMHLTILPRVLRDVADEIEKGGVQ